MSIIGTALFTQRYWPSFISFFVSENHQTWCFQLLIWHKQNPHTEINQVSVTAKTISQPGIKLCVASVAVQLGKQTFMGYMRHFLRLFNIHVSSEHRTYYDSKQMNEIFQLHYGAVNRTILCAWERKLQNIPQVTVHKNISQAPFAAHV